MNMNMEIGILGKAPAFPSQVFFTGTTALKKGTGVCFDQDYGTAANADQSRRVRVALPTTSNHKAFAGVVMQDYSANPTGQMIDILCPGSVGLVSTLIATTVDSTRLGLVVGSAGQFAWQGLDGPGRVLALQTVANVSDTDDTGGPVTASNDADYAYATKTLTISSGFTYAAAGDRVIVLGGTVDAGAAKIGYQETTVASVTSGNAVVLTDNLVDTSDTALTDNGRVAVAVVRGYPLCLALIENLPQVTSGCVEYLGMLNNAASQSMVGGTTVAVGTVILGDGDCTATLADGTIEGEKKAFMLTGALTTQDYLITVTSGQMSDQDGALASMELDGASDTTVLQWHGNIGGGILGAWTPLVNIGTALS